MQWWNDLLEWFGSDEGRLVVTGGIVPFVAILVAGIVAALIGRSATRRVLAFQDREAKASAISALIAAGRKSAIWNSLSAEEKQHVEFQSSEAEVRIRLLPLNGAALAGEWSAHQIAEMKKNSASFSFQAEQTLSEFRDRLLEWQHKPSRAKKLFKFDLERWKYEESQPVDPVVVQQQEWAARQADYAPEPRDSTPAVPPVTVRPPTEQTAVAPVAAPAMTPAAATPPAAEPESYSPPVTASTVRQRINPEDELDR